MTPNDEKEKVKDRIALLSVRENDTLADRISQILDVPLVKIKRDQFDDLERVPIIQENISGKNAYVISTLGLRQEPDVSFMDTVRLFDALARCSVVNKVGVFPDHWFAAQDKTNNFRTAITGELAADIFGLVNMTSLITVEFHAEQIEGFYGRKRADSLRGSPIIADYVMNTYPYQFIAVNADAGGIRQRDELGKELKVRDRILGVGSYSGARDRDVKDEKKKGDYIGQDPKGQYVVIYDDMGRTLETMENCAEEAKNKGAAKVIGACAHLKTFGSEKFMKNLSKGFVDELVVLNTRPEIVSMIEQNELMRQRITVLDISPYIAQTIRRLELGYSVREMMGEIKDRSALYNILRKAGQ
ncbi:MAG: ribose-phosphate diphosphokinase [archaeon]